jgi:hypothetical protein
VSLSRAINAETREEAKAVPEVRQAAGREVTGEVEVILEEAEEEEAAVAFTAAERSFMTRSSLLPMS